ncbi:MAG: O-antigen ligase family protein [Flavobacteriia bacterium]|nr:O-antigen ligase family protein [Flavobacteriia bacterium]
MSKNWQRSDVHLLIHFVGISLIATGLSFSKVFMSLGTFLILFNAIAEGNFQEKAKIITENSTLKWIIAFFLIHLIALVWTTDFQYASHDIKTKLTLLIIPLILISKPLDLKNTRTILFLFVASVFLASFVNFANYQHWIGHHQYVDIRDMSLFGSHIRFSILVVFSCVIILNFWKSFTVKIKVIGLFIIAWLLFYTFYSQVLTGYIAFLTAILVIAFIKLFKKNKLSFSLVLSFFGIGCYCLFIFLKPVEVHEINTQNLPKFTKEGNQYQNDSTLLGFSNNIPVFLTICDKEMEREWRKKSVKNYYGKDALNQLQRTTLIRYLCSKNLTRDGSGVKMLADEDIAAIEKGIANYNETRIGFIARLYGIKYQIQNAEDPNGHSLLQRLEYWKAAQKIIQKHWLIGVGTGDVQNEFNHQYQLMKTKLIEENRLRAHNYYLTSWLSFGILGLILFLGINISFLIQQIKEQQIMGIVFGAIMIVTFLFEDTIETQLGITIFAFFYGLFCQKKISSNNQ